MITQSRAIKLTSNGLISELLNHPRFVVKTFTKVDPVFTFSDSLTVISRTAVERLIDKGILLSREESAQSFELSPEWGGRMVA